MANTLVNIRIPEPMLSETNKIVEEEGYVNVQEYIKNIIREDIKKRKLEWALLELKKMAGSAAGKKIKVMSKDKWDEILLKEHGLWNNPETKARIKQRKAKMKKY